MGNMAGRTAIINDVSISIFAPEVDKAGIDDRYDFYKITETREKHLNGRAVLALPAFKGCIQSITYTGDFEYGSNSLFVMTPKDALAVHRIRQAAERGGFKTILAEKVTAVQAQPDGDGKPVKLGEIDLFRLLVNASFNSDSIPYDNAAEHLWVKRAEKRNGAKIIAASINIKKDYSFTLSVQTFCGESLKEKIRYPKGRNWDSMPKYIFFGRTGQMLPDVTADKDEPRYIRRSYGSKSTLNFLGFGNSDYFEKAKAGFLCDLETRFNDKYKGIAHIGYKKLPEVTKEFLISTRNAKDEDIDRMPWKVGEIVVVDLVKDEESKRICTVISEHLFKNNIPSCISDKPKKKANNIVVVHASEWYEEHNLKDEYRKYRDGYAIQHVEIENLDEKTIDKLESLSRDDIRSGKSSPIVQAILHNIQFKRDLEEGRITAIDLSEFKRTGPWQFGIRKSVRDEENKNITDEYYGLLELHADNTISLQCKKNEDIFNTEDEFKDIADVLWQTEDTECVIRDENGNIVTIKDTEIFPLPDLAGMKKTLFEIECRKDPDKKRGEGIKRETHVLAGTEYEIENPRLQLWGALGDVNYFENGNDFCYYIDDPGKSMNQTVSTSCHIRRIEGAGAKEIGKRLIPTFGNIQIRNGPPSVLPFACKYIREKMLQEFPELRAK